MNPFIDKSSLLQIRVIRWVDSKFSYEIEHRQISLKYSFSYSNSQKDCETCLSAQSDPSGTVFFESTLHQVLFLPHEMLASETFHYQQYNTKSHMYDTLSLCGLEWDLPNPRSEQFCTAGHSMVGQMVGFGRNRKFALFEESLHFSYSLLQIIGKMFNSIDIEWSGLGRQGFRSPTYAWNWCTKRNP